MEGAGDPRRAGDRRHLRRVRLVGLLPPGHPRLLCTPGRAEEAPRGAVEARAARPVPHRAAGTTGTDDTLVGPLAEGAEQRRRRRPGPDPVRTERRLAARGGLAA